MIWNRCRGQLQPFLRARWTFTSGTASPKSSGAILLWGLLQIFIYKIQKWKTKCHDTKVLTEPWCWRYAPRWTKLERLKSWHMWGETALSSEASCPFFSLWWIIRCCFSPATEPGELLTTESWAALLHRKLEIAGRANQAVDQGQHHKTGTKELCWTWADSKYVCTTLSLP